MQSPPLPSAHSARTMQLKRPHILFPTHPYPYSDLSSAKYEWTSPEFEVWDEALDSIGGQGTWREIARNNNDTIGNHVLGGTTEDRLGNGVILPYQKWVLMQRINEYNLCKKYDYFVVTRTDQFYGYPCCSNQPTFSVL